MPKPKETRLIDYSMSRPAVSAIVKSGYVGAMRYLSLTPAKNLTKAEAKALHDGGCAIGLVWETTATRASEGVAAGETDCALAEKQARGLGYPENCPIFYAVDFDADPARVLPYFSGVYRVSKYAWGAYGSARVVDAVKAAHPHAVCWQTAAWSGGVISKHADLYQRIGHEAPAVPGGGYDENVVLKPLPLWGKSGVVTVGPPAKHHKPKRYSRLTRILMRRLTKRLSNRHEPVTHQPDRDLAAALSKQLARTEKIK
jgi:glycoside hydrolase-like protein